MHAKPTKNEARGMADIWAVYCILLLFASRSFEAIMSAEAPPNYIVQQLNAKGWIQFALDESVQIQIKHCKVRIFSLNSVCDFWWLGGIIQYMIP